VQYAKLAIATFCNVFATRTAQLILFSFIVMSGPGGEGKGSGALTILGPVAIFSFVLAILARMLGERSAMIVAALVSAGLLLWAPWSMIATSANPYMIAAFAGALGTLALLFSLSRFGLVPATLPSKYIDHGNASIWLGITTATLAAVYGGDLLMASSATNAMMNCSAVVFASAAFARLLSMSGNSPRGFALAKTKIAASPPPGDLTHAVTPTSSQPITVVLEYMKRHRGARDTLRLTIALSFVFTLWNMLLLCLIMESDEPGGTDLHPLFLFAFAGCAIGALLAPRALRVARHGTVLSATVCGIILSSLICICATNLSTVKYALGIAGVSSGIALVALDSMLQRVVPMRIRSIVAAIRDSLVAVLALSVIFASLHYFERVSLVNIFRMLAVFHLLAASLLIFAWPSFSRFLYRCVIWPFTSRARKFTCDGPHHLRSTRVSIFALAEQTWDNAAIICGGFALPTKFLLITQRLRLLDRFMLNTIGGVAAANDTQAIETTKQLLRKGYNVILVSDALTDEKSALSKSLYKQFTKQKYQVIPCAVLSEETNHGVYFKCGVPFTKHRVISPRKLAAELNFLSTGSQSAALPDDKEDNE